MLVAWDPVTQKEKWRTPGGGGIGGGTVTTAGNLVFQVIPDGHFVAYSADKGTKLVDIQTGLRGGMGPPITYMLDGKQYIALMGGTGSFGNRGGGPGPGPAPAPAPAAGRGGATDSPDVANAQAAQRGAGAGAAAPAPAPGPPGFGGAGATPKLLVFAIDGKAELPK
jgi:quinohemoprotein ethanol dehydrogenase